MIGKTISHYKILEKLGQGGMGVVYKAEDTNLKRTVALKFLPKEMTQNQQAKDRFIHEARAASALDHPNICTIYEINETKPAPGEPGDGQMFIAMACYEGETLKKKIEKGAMEKEEAINIVIQIAQGLTEAHKKGIIHRDIKPANIMITEDGVVKILDFGLVKLAGQSKLTKTGTTLGTVAYMSPEQARGKDVDFRTDIWSLAVVLYETLSGRLPFEGDYDQAVIYSIIHEDPEPLSQYNTEIGEGLQTIINKALLKNINNRYQTSTDILQELKGIEVGISPHPVFKPVLKNVSRKRLTIFAAAILIIMTAFVIIFGYFIPGIMKPTEISVKSLPSIAIMYFENTTGDEKFQWFSDGLPNMLTSGLHQASNLWVPGTQMIYEVLKKVDKNAESVNKSTAIKVALKLRVKTILSGNIFKWGKKFRIDYQIQDVTKNELIYTGNVSGSEPFDLADNLALQILDKLEVDLPEKGLPGIKEVTTDSVEALRHYLQGINYSHKAYWKEACASLFKAISIDTTFAMAYIELFRIGGNAGISYTKLEAMLAKAVLYANNTSERERLVILDLHAYYYGELKKSRLLSKELIQKYPTASEGFAMLASDFYNRREWKQSIKYYKRWAELTNSLRAISAIVNNFEKLGELDSARYYIEKLISLHPNDAGGYVTLSIHYIIKGEFDKAIHEAQRAVAIKPLVPWTHRQLARAYFFINQFDSAQVELERMAEPGWEAAKIVNSAIINCFQGKEKMMFNLLQKGKNSSSPRTLLRVNKSERTYYDLKMNRDKAKEIWLDFESDYWKSWFPEIKGHEVFVAESLSLEEIPMAYFDGDFSKALVLCAKVDDEIEKNDLGGYFKLRNLWWRSNILYNAQNYKEASVKYKELIDEDAKTVYRYRRALCLYNLKKYKQAKQALLQVNKTEDHSLGHNDYKWNGIAFAYSYPRTFYLLGLVNEKLKKPKQAIQAYQRLLEIWKDADKDLPELMDAKVRYGKLIGEK